MKFLILCVVSLLAFVTENQNMSEINLNFDIVTAYTRKPRTCNATEVLNSSKTINFSRLVKLIWASRGGQDG